MRSVTRTMAAAAMALALPAASAEPADELTCAGDAVSEALRQEGARQVCFVQDAYLSNFMEEITVTAGSVSLSDVKTMEMGESPPTRTCQARLAYEIVIQATALGPPAPYRLWLKGRLDRVYYRVGRYDDGRLYAEAISRPGAASPTGPVPPECWKVERMRDASKEP